MAGGKTYSNCTEGIARSCSIGPRSLDRCSDEHSSLPGGKGDTRTRSNLQSTQRGTNPMTSLWLSMVSSRVKTLFVVSVIVSHTIVAIAPPIVPNTTVATPVRGNEFAF